MRRFTQFLFTVVLTGMSLGVVAQLEDPIVIISIGENQTINCTSDPVTIGVVIGNWRPGFVYHWSSGQNDSVILVKPQNTSNYVITVTNDLENIHSIKSFTVKVENNPLMADNISYHIDKYHCPGETFELNPQVSGGYSPFTYNWSSGQNTKVIHVAPLNSVNYFLTITDVCGNDKIIEAAVTIDDRDPLLVPPLTEVGFKCDGSEIKIFPKLNGISGGVGFGYVYTFSSWNQSNIAESVEAHDGDAYEARVTDACQLDESNTRVVLVQEPLEKHVLSDLNVCSGSAVDVTGQSDIQLFYWDGSELKVNEDMIFTHNETITLNYIDECGTERTVARKVNVIVVDSEFEISLSEEGSIAELNITNPQVGSEYLWTAEGHMLGQGSNLKIAKEGAITQEVNLLVTDEMGCKGNRTKTVTFEINIDAPTAFTPNDDGNNDAFSIDMGEELMSFHIKIFDRWGQLVYESSDQYFMWYGGEKLNSQINTYAYRITALTANGTAIQKSGTVSVVN